MALTLNGSANTLTGLATAGAGIPGSEVVAAGALGNGGIIQVQNTTFTTNSTVALADSDVYYTVSDLNCSITPTSASNKILISGHMMGETDNREYYFSWRLARTISGGSLTAIGINTHSSPGNRTVCTGVFPAHYHNDQNSTPSSVPIPNYLDSPSTTTATTYHIQILTAVDAGTPAGTFHLNHCVGDSGADSSYERGASWLTLMEVVA
tara:strand:- start:22 stop:648 length:627 start_codon:yes stop_codon:yes gene_type:complete